MDVNHPSSGVQRNDLKPGRRANGPGSRSHPGATVFDRATRIDAMAAKGKFEPPPLSAGSGIPTISESQEGPLHRVGSFQFHGGIMSG
jgi:hypothetical protein